MALGGPSDHRPGRVRPRRAFAEAQRVRRALPRLVWPTFHGGGARLGWNAAEASLSPAAVGSPGFGLAW